MSAKNVDWFASGGFDVMLLSSLANTMNRARPNPADAIKRLARTPATSSTS